MKLKTATNHWNKHQSPSYHFLFNGAFKWFVQTSKTTTKLNNGKDRQTTATQTESQSQAELNTLRLPWQIGAQVLNSAHSGSQGKSAHRFWTQHTPATKANRCTGSELSTLQLPRQIKFWTQGVLQSTTTRGDNYHSDTERSVLLQHAQGNDNDYYFGSEYSTFHWGQRGTEHSAIQAQRQANSAGVECNIIYIPPRPTACKHRPTACKHKRKLVKQEKQKKRTIHNFPWPSSKSINWPAHYFIYIYMYICIPTQNEWWQKLEQLKTIT